MMQNKSIRQLYVVLTAIFLSCTAKKPTSFYEVVAIADGDTFTLLTQDKEQKKVRLYGIDCPEKGQPFGANAKQKLSELIFRKRVSIDIEDTDRYGRAVAVVYNETGECINEALLQSGLSWHYKEYDNSTDWAKLEEQARSKKLGLWSDHNAIAPWEWRKGKRQKTEIQY